MKQNIQATEAFDLGKEYLEYTAMSKFGQGINVATNVSLKIKNFILKDVLLVELIEENKVIESWDSNKMNYVIEEKSLRRKKVLDLGVKAFNEYLG